MELESPMIDDIERVRRHVERLRNQIKELETRSDNIDYPEAANQ